MISTLARKAFAGGVHDPEGAAGIPRVVVTAYEVRQQLELSRADLVRLVAA